MYEHVLFIRGPSVMSTTSCTIMRSTFPAKNMLMCTYLERKSKGGEKTCSRTAKKYKNTNYLGRRKHFYKHILSHYQGDIKKKSKKRNNTKRRRKETRGEKKKMEKRRPI